MLSSRAYYRSARSGDQSAVFRFTRHTYVHGDYIRMVWRQWLNDPDGKLMVATLNRRAVAVAHVARLSPTETWLEGLRVDPRYRRRGLASGLTRCSLKKAAGMSAACLRFLTSSSNTPIHILAAKLGFQKVAVVQSYQAAPVETDAAPLTRASIADLPELLNFIANSPLLADLHGLFGSGWQFQVLEQPQIEARLQSGETLITRHDGIIQALAIVEKRLYDKSLVICYTDGRPEAMPALLAGLRKLAARQKLTALVARLPPQNPAVAIFEAAGFQPTRDENFWIYEKFISGSGQASQT
jgi:GNAT superfamily N-acetyltransferase